MAPRYLTVRRVTSATTQWAGFCSDLQGVRHDLVERSEAGPATIVEALVTYTGAGHLPKCPGAARH